MRIGQWAVKKFESWILAAAYRDERTRVKLVSLCDSLIARVFNLGVSLMPDEWFLPDIWEMEEKLKASSPIILQAMNMGYMWDEHRGWVSEPIVPIVPMYGYAEYGDILLPAFTDQAPFVRKSWGFKKRVYIHVGVTGRHVMALNIDMKWGRLAMAVVFNRGTYICTNRLIAKTIEKSLDFTSGTVIRVTEERLNAIKTYSGVPQQGVKMVEGPWKVQE